MKTIQTLRKFKTKRFTLTVKAVEDYDVDTSFDETGETDRKLASGDLVSFGLVAQIYVDGRQVGEDSVWNCIHPDPSDAIDHYGIRQQARKASEEYGKPVCVGSYFSDLIRESVREARANLGQLQSVTLRK